MTALTLLVLGIGCFTLLVWLGFLLGPTI